MDSSFLDHSMLLQMTNSGDFLPCAENLTRAEKMHGEDEGGVGQIYALVVDSGRICEFP